MGYGDQLMATGMARGAKARGKRIAFGDGKRILWSAGAEEIFRDNPNIAAPGSERDWDIEWVEYYKGKRIYNRQGDGRWIWNYSFKALSGELFFSEAEQRHALQSVSDFVLMEPNVPQQKSVSKNKDWGFEKYVSLARKFSLAGFRVSQFAASRAVQSLDCAVTIDARSFRQAVSILSRAVLYVGPEGGLHHGAAAVSVPAVVLFGGFIPPQVTGYDEHINLTGGAEACGSLAPCDHCKAAMNAISVDEVYEAAMGFLQK